MTHTQLHMCIYVSAHHLHSSVRLKSLLGLMSTFQFVHPFVLLLPLAVLILCRANRWALSYNNASFSVIH